MDRNKPKSGSDSGRGQINTRRAAWSHDVLPGVIVIFAVVLALAGYSLWQGWQRVQQEAAEKTENLSRVIERYVYTSIHESDLILQVAQEEYSDSTRHGDSLGKTYSDFLLTLRGRLSSVVNLRAADLNGLVKYGTGVIVDKPVSVAERTFFQVAKDSSGLTVSTPFLGRSSGEWVLPLARRLERANGRVDGVVYAGSMVKILTSLFASLQIGQHSVIALFDADTNIYVRHPEPNGLGSAIGAKIRSPQFFQAWNAGLKAATYRATSAYDGVFRTYHYQQVGDYPLYIVVGLAEDDYLAPWMNQLGVTTGFLILLALLVTMLARSLNRSRQAQWQSYQELVENRNLLQTSEYHFRTLFDSPAIAQLLLDPSDLRIVDCNRAMSDALGYSREELLKTCITDLDVALPPIRFRRSSSD